VRRGKGTEGKEVQGDKKIERQKKERGGRGKVGG
jgi:hypothetical protein